METTALHNEDNRIHWLPFIIQTLTVHNGKWRRSSCFKELKIYSCGGRENSWNCQSRQPSTWLRFEPRTCWMQVTITSAARSQQHMEHVSNLWRSPLSPERHTTNYVNRLHHIPQQLFSVSILALLYYTSIYETCSHFLSLFVLPSFCCEPHICFGLRNVASWK